MLSNQRVNLFVFTNILLIIMKQRIVSKNMKLKFKLIFIHKINN